MLYFSFNMLYIPEADLATTDHPASAMELFGTIHSFFYKQLGLGLSPQSYLYFQGFWGSKLLNGC